MDKSTGQRQEFDGIFDDTFTKEFDETLTPRLPFVVSLTFIKVRGDGGGLDRFPATSVEFAAATDIGDQQRGPGLGAAGDAPLGEGNAPLGEGNGDVAPQSRACGEVA